MEGRSDIEKGQVDESTFNDIALLKAESPMPSSCCIFKVPEVLRRRKEGAYEPDIISIGPFHRGAEKFQLVENVKKWYLKNLLARQLPNPTGLRLDSLVNSMSPDSLTESVKRLTERIKVEELDERARGCYSDPCNHLDQNNFIQMLILDGCFLIELFRKTPRANLQDEDDPIFNMSWMLDYLYRDLLLLENQLPWFVLERLYNLIERGSSKPLSEVVIDFFKDSVADSRIFSYLESESSIKILHILDLIRTSLVQEHRVFEYHRFTKFPMWIPSAAALSDLGVKFKMGNLGCILNITFKGGVLTIPPLAIDERTDPLFRNLMAYEQCYHSASHKITSYAVLMNNLIDTNKDVDLLCRKDIIANWLSADDALKFFSDLYKDTTVIDFDYNGLCHKVHNYLNHPWNKIPWSGWKRKLKRDYFDTPWSTISFFAAFVLLGLTFLQTIYTIQQYYHSPN